MFYLIGYHLHHFQKRFQGNNKYEPLYQFKTFAFVELSLNYYTLKNKKKTNKFE